MQEVEALTGFLGGVDQVRMHSCAVDSGNSICSPAVPHSLRNPVVGDLDLLVPSLNVVGNPRLGGRARNPLNQTSVLGGAGTVDPWREEGPWALSCWAEAERKRFRQCLETSDESLAGRSAEPIVLDA